MKGEKHSITFQCIHVFDTDSGPDYTVISCYLFPVTWVCPHYLSNNENVFPMEDVSTVRVRWYGGRSEYVLLICIM